MPIYEYHCSKCNQNVEVLQNLSDPPAQNCDCGAKGTLTKLMSVTNVGSVNSTCATGVDCGAAGGDGGGRFSCGKGGCGS